ERPSKGGAVTKQEFVDKVAGTSGLTKADAGRAVDAFLESVTDTLKSGGSVTFVGFGKFSTGYRAERQGVNPQKPGGKITIPAAKTVKFTAGSALKAAVRG